MQYFYASPTGEYNIANSKAIDLNIGFRLEGYTEAWRMLNAQRVLLRDRINIPEQNIHHPFTWLYNKGIR